MADEKKSLKMKDINEALSDYKVQSLEGVILGGDIEIEMDISGGAQLLALPSEGFIAEQLEIVDPVALRAARNAVRDAMARTLATELRSDAILMTDFFNP